MIGEQNYPTLVVQEGGYRVRTLGTNTRNFFVGLAAGHSAARAPRPRPILPPSAPARRWNGAAPSWPTMWGACARW